LPKNETNEANHKKRLGVIFKVDGDSFDDAAHIVQLHGKSRTVRQLQHHRQTPKFADLFKTKQNITPLFKTAD